MDDFAILAACGCRTVRFCDDCRDAAGRVFRTHKPLVGFVMKRFYGKRFWFHSPDAWSAAWTGFLKAIQHYEPGRGSTFAHYAILCIRRRIRDHLTWFDRHAETFVAMPSEEWQDRLDSFAAHDPDLPDPRLSELLDAASLPAVVKGVMALRAGGHTLEGIAGLMGWTSKEAARKRQLQGMAELSTLVA